MATSHVSSKIKKKILQGEYVELSKLLPTLSDSDDEDKSGKHEKSKKFHISRLGQMFPHPDEYQVRICPKELQGML